ncbi:MAG: acyl-CoA dehydrogenase family protein [Gammaproteobacteria bacterium]
MSELKTMIEENVVRLFDDQIDRDFFVAVEENGFPHELWQTVLELGIDRVLATEADGGMNGTWSDAYPVVRACGLYGVPLPIPEAIASHWLMHNAGLSLRAGIPAVLADVVPSTADLNRLDMHVERVPWGRDASYFIGLQETSSGADVIVIDAAQAQVTADQNLAYDARDSVTFQNAAIAERGSVSLAPDALRCVMAMLRSAQIAGAGSACLKLGLEYTSEREQFGRPLARFQAIQHHLANMSGELATVEAMSASAFESLDRYGLTNNDNLKGKFDIAAAKCRASDAVEPLTKIGHQVHGAIGFTYEYGLHFLTRRLWSWRAEFGGSGEWAKYLGEVAVASGGDGIWGVITN